MEDAHLAECSVVGFWLVLFFPGELLFGPFFFSSFSVVVFLGRVLGRRCWARRFSRIVAGPLPRRSGEIQSRGHRLPELHLQLAGDLLLRRHGLGLETGLETGPKRRVQVGWLKLWEADPRVLVTPR